MQVLLADDNKLLRDGIRPFVTKLKPRPSVLEAESFEETLLLAEGSGGIDLVLLSLGMRGVDGMSSVKLLRGKLPNAKIVLLINNHNLDIIMSAIADGISGVISKDVSGTCLVNALHLVVAGEVYVPSEAMSAIARRALRISDEAIFSGARKGIALSPGETQLVPFLIDGLPNKAIAQRLGIEEAAVKARLRGLFKKIGVANRAQAAMALREQAQN